MRWCALILALIGAVGLLVWLLWPRLPEWVERREAMIGDASATVLLIRLPTIDWQWELVNKPEGPKTVKAWREDLDADIVFNAAYFNEDNTPSGYLKVQGGENAVAWPTADAQADRFGYTFLVQPQWGGIGLTYLPSKVQEEPAGDALLSFPTLLANGEPLIAENSGLYASRTILAENADGRAYLVITEKGSVTLYDMAQWLAQQPEGFVLAGNLDGGPSTGVSIENGAWDIEESSAVVPSVIVGRYIRD